MKKKLAGLICAGAALLSGCSSVTNTKEIKTNYSSWSDMTTINANWQYLEDASETIPAADASGYVSVNLPHTWNAHDMLKTKEYRRSASWYRKNLELSQTDCQQRLYLRFGAAAQVADVYVNGKHLGNHNGGFSAFTYEFTDVAKAGVNTVDVRVCNKWTKYRLPLRGDYNVHGGLYRSVQLLRSPQVSISRKYLGSKGIRIWSPSVSEAKAETKMRVQLDNGTTTTGTYNLIVRLTGPDGKKIEKEQEITLTGNQMTTANLDLPTVTEPLLWSPETPNLYEVSVKLAKGDQVIDQVNTTHGFRWFKFTTDKGFFLNGKPCKLRGVNRHQCREGKGWALSPKDHIEDIKRIKKLGMNWLRLAHYQQDDLVLELCDRMGILVWEEIPLGNTITYDQKFYDVASDMMKDMIEQHFNHPSIVLWGISNEIYMSQRGTDKAQKIHNILNDLIHQEDPIRKSVIAVHPSKAYTDTGLTAIPDVVGYNIYFGWYGKTFADATAELEKFRSWHPSKPFIVSEYGAGSILGKFSNTPKRWDFTETWQCMFHESHLEQFENMEWLSGWNIWPLNDFPSTSKWYSIPGINQKGLLTYGRVKKDLYYFYKAAYTKEPMVYIAEKGKGVRKDGTTDIKVYTTCNEVEYIINGVKAGVAKPSSVGVALLKNVSLNQGDNDVKVIGKSAEGDIETSCTWTVKTVSKLITASDSEGLNEAYFACDGDSHTRWATNVKGAWWQKEFKKSQKLSKLSIRWFKGEERIYSFKVLSSENGQDWTKVFTGKSSGKSTGAEEYQLKGNNSKYIRLIVNGNNINEWSSIYEIDLK